MNLRRVHGKFILFYPYSFPENQRFRGSAGYVVDLDAPLEAEWCAGQEYKLEPAPDAKAATPIEHPIAARMIREHQAANPGQQAPVAPTPPDPPAQTEAPAATSASTASTTTNEDDDLRVPRPQRPAKPAAKAS